LRRALDLLKKKDVNCINTAYLYGDSEGLLGTAGARKQFMLDFKVKDGVEPVSAKTH
jgi:hypothetical protein